MKDKKNTVTTAKNPRKTKKQEKINNELSRSLSTTIGKKRSFAMAEAHKRLRTNILFSFADEGKCRVIGITSAMAHEGKSTTSMNLAYDLMKAGKKVILIAADMRLSRVEKVLEINRAPGLSNLLVGKCGLQGVIQSTPVLDNLKVISCGDIPPNPTELLSSKRFAAVIEALRGVYEYVIIDLPPVTDVSDALIVSKLTDGMLIVVRQEFADKHLLDDTVHQLLLSEAHIIGFVLTCAQRKNTYSTYKYRNRGGRHSYGYGYEYDYGYYRRDYYGHYHGHHHDNDPYWQETPPYDMEAEQPHKPSDAHAAAQTPPKAD